ncbi:DNA-packaging protein [Elizabethkingia anophelis]|uniref:DNA-packaging protein n=1 Tax=Elizabethkingia anophelis TaxID=1117645 RepID=UPI001C8852A7|nr:DNA-packaging protein [Elizabethkingia anophelis]
MDTTRVCLFLNKHPYEYIFDYCLFYWLVIVINQKTLNVEMEKKTTKKTTTAKPAAKTTPKTRKATPAKKTSPPDKPEELPQEKPVDKRIGNQFWKLRSKHGRDTLFSTPEKLWEAACEYFEWATDNPLPETRVFQYKGKVVTEVVPIMRAMTMGQLCFYLKCDESYFRSFKRNENNKDFFTVIADIENVIYTQKFQGAAGNLLNANIISRELGLIDKQEMDNTTTTKIENVDELLSKMSEDQRNALLSLAEEADNNHE